MHAQNLFRQTDRLLIRPPMMDDYEAWRDGHLAHPNMASPFDDVPKSRNELTRDHFQQVIDKSDALRRADQEYILWGFERESGQWVGAASLFDVLRGTQQNAWIGGYLLNSHWSKGYAEEAGQVILQIGFQTIGLHRIEALTSQDNRPTQRVLARLGFRHEGQSRRRVLNRGAWRDVEVFALTSEDYFHSEEKSS